MKYALIGLSPYSFHYDESKTYGQWRLLRYAITFKDLHNFSLSAKDVRNLFREDYLSQEISLENFDVNLIYFSKTARKMSFNERIGAYDEFNAWNNKNYPETRAENIKILDSYLTLCEKNKIRPIMFLPTMTEGYMKNFSKQKLDEFYYLVHQAQKKHSSAVFVDGWKFPGFSDEDFYDVSHMNIQGSAKFSAILNDFIEQLENN